MAPRTPEVIIATHSNPGALYLCLRSLAAQCTDNLRVCVAEDGECPLTLGVVERLAGAFPAGGIRHLRQPHQGFRKNRILNEAIRTSGADYLIFVDGDCVALPGFLSRHLSARSPGRFLSGGVVRLTLGETTALLDAHEADGNPVRELKSPCSWATAACRLLKSGRLPLWLAGLLERASPVPRTWNGGNSSGWRADLLAVNGFDESMGYGADDVDLGFRLNASGVSGRLVRYSACLLHLEHERAESDLRVRTRNSFLVRRARDSRDPWAADGVRKP